MGAAWCKNKTQAAIDKIQQVYPSGANQKTSDKQSNGDASRDTLDVVDSPVVHSTPQNTFGAWQDVTLEVPESEPLSKTPIPPPRKKKQLRRKVGVCRPPPPEPPASPPPRNNNQIVLKPRPKNTSTVSLPNYNELTPRKEQKKAFLSPQSRRKTPTAISDTTVERVEKYMRKCRSFGSMHEHLSEKLSTMDTSSESDDSWAGLDDWDLGVIEHDTHTDNSPPVVPTSKLNKRPERKSTTIPPTIAEDDNVRQDSNSTSFPPLSLPLTTNDDSWFGDNWSSPLQNGDLSLDERKRLIRQEAEETGTKDDANLNDVKKELQSIIYDFNKAKKLSTSSMEVLPTQPIRNIKKKISVTSVTPPPSPEISDVEDSSQNVETIKSMILNKSGEIDETTHSTLLRLLKECQNIEGALEKLGLQNIVLEDTEMPGVHSHIHYRKIQNGGRNSPTVNVCKSVDSGLDMHSNADSQKQDSQSQMSFSASTDTLNGSKSIDSGLNDFEEHPSPIKTKNMIIQNETEINTKPQSSNVQRLTLKDLEKNFLQKKSDEAKREEGGINKESEEMARNLLRKPKLEHKEVPESGGSSGRSSMTPSLNELEAALSDMLEKSTEDDDPFLPVTSNNDPFKTTSSTTNPFLQDKTVNEKTTPQINGSAVKLPSDVH